MARQYYTTARLSENQQTTPEGYLLCLNVPIARTGALIYAAEEMLDEDGNPIIEGVAGRVIVTRAPEVLFSEQTISSFEGKPITLMHPPVMLTPENWNEYADGFMQNVRPSADRETLVCDMLVMSADAIYAVKNGLREVSLGYDARYLRDAPGLGRQTEMIGNHCALVPAGRCGPECAIQDNISIKEMSMTKLKKLQDQFKGFFSAFDSAVEELEKKDEAPPKEEETPPADPPAEKEEEEAPAFDAVKAFGDLAARVADIEAAIKGMKPKEEEEKPPATDEAPPEEEQKTCDAETLARAEILAPGIAATADVIPAALKSAYATTDGKDIIDRLSAGKAPAFDSAALFVAAAELMKEKRRAEMADSRKAPAKDQKVVDQIAHFNERAKAIHIVPKF